MKKINSILAGLLLTSTVLLTQQATAQAPQKMSYQSVIRNSSNVLLANTAVGIRISVLQGSATGTPVYVETQTATTNGNGLLSLQIGTGTATTGTFASINWAAGPYFIKTETDPSGGTNYTITGTQEILSVPYAMYAAKSVNDSAQTAEIQLLQSKNIGLGVKFIICKDGSYPTSSGGAGFDPFVGEIKMVAFETIPGGWLECNGQELPINQNLTLFSLLGTTYGGNGVTFFKLPNLNNRTPKGIPLGLIQN
jgi:hypothetical protein